MARLQGDPLARRKGASDLRNSQNSEEDQMRKFTFAAIGFAGLALSTTAAFAQVSPECGINDATRAIAGCTVDLQKQGISRADQVRALALRADAYNKQNQKSAAAADLQRALKLAPNDAVALAVRGRLHATNSEYQKSIADLNAALRVSPSYVYALWLRGSMQIETNRMVEARADLDRAIALDPSSAASRMHRGRLNRLEGKLEQALSDLNSTIALSPRWTVALVHRGDTYQLMGDYGRAMTDYEAVLAIDGNHAQARGRRDAAAAQLRARNASATPVQPPPVGGTDQNGETFSQ